MNAPEKSLPKKTRSGGGVYFWAGLGCFALGIALAVLQYSLKQLFVPWYLPVLSTLGALLLLWSCVEHRSVFRFVALALVGAVAGFEWLFLGALARLPEYEGPARVGARLPVFETQLASGRRFTDRNLRDGTNSVLVFFRGRW